MSSDILSQLDALQRQPKIHHMAIRLCEWYPESGRLVASETVVPKGMDMLRILGHDEQIRIHNYETGVSIDFVYDSQETGLRYDPGEVIFRPRRWHQEHYLLKTNGRPVRLVIPRELI